jgi:hypothetical protein
MKIFNLFKYMVLAPVKHLLPALLVLNLFHWIWDIDSACVQFLSFAKNLNYKKILIL